MRMLAGLLAGRPFLSVLTGDASLCARPMGRVVDPLRRMGATIDGARRRPLAPLSIRGGSLEGVRAELAVASGQVKTALVLAGLQAGGNDRDRRAGAEPRPHGAHARGPRCAARAGRRPDAARVTPARSRPVRARRAGRPVVGRVLRRRRHDHAGILDRARGRLAQPGAGRVPRRAARDGRRHPRCTRAPTGSGSRSATSRSTPRRCTASSIHATEAIIDELPALVVAGAFAEGVTEIRDAAELRVKESDRIATLEQELTQLGRRRRGRARRPDRAAAARRGAASLKSHGDHRIAMARRDRRQRGGRASRRSAVSVPSRSRTPSSPSTSRPSPGGTAGERLAGRGHRRTVGVGQVDGGPRGRGARSVSTSSTPARCTASVTLAALEAGPTSPTVRRCGELAAAMRASSSSDESVGSTAATSARRSAAPRSPPRSRPCRRTRPCAPSAGRPPAVLGRASTAAGSSRVATSGPSSSPTRPVKVFLTASERGAGAAPPARRGRGGRGRSTWTPCARTSPDATRSTRAARRRR